MKPRDFTRARASAPRKTFLSKNRPKPRLFALFARL